MTRPPALTVKEGKLKLSEYIVHPNHRVQGVMMIQQGKVIAQSARDCGFPNWQSGGEQSIYYNLNIPEILQCIDTL